MVQIVQESKANVVPAPAETLDTREKIVSAVKPIAMHLEGKKRQSMSPLGSLGPLDLLRGNVGQSGLVSICCPYLNHS